MTSANPTSNAATNLDSDVPDTELESEKPLESQARRVINKFGGARALARALESCGQRRDPATVFRWLYPRSRGGCDGLIPTQAWPSILLAARHHGIIITAEDMDPRPQLVRPEPRRHNIKTVIRRKVKAIADAATESDIFD